MGKDKTILSLIENLKSILDFNLLTIVDNWPSDLCAIGFHKGNKAGLHFYVNYIEKKMLKFDYDLELIEKSIETEFNVLKEGRGVSKGGATKATVGQRVS